VLFFFLRVPLRLSAFVAKFQNTSRFPNPQSPRETLEGFPNPQSPCETLEGFRKPSGDTLQEKPSGVWSNGTEA